MRKRARCWIQGEGDDGGGRNFGMVGGGGYGEKARRGVQQKDSARRRWRRMNSWICSSSCVVCVVDMVRHRYALDCTKMSL